MSTVKPVGRTSEDVMLGVVLYHHLIVRIALRVDLTLWLCA